MNFVLIFCSTCVPLNSVSYFRSTPPSYFLPLGYPLLVGFEDTYIVKHRGIPIISPGLIFVKKVVFAGLIFGGA